MILSFLQVAQEKIVDKCTAMGSLTCTHRSETSPLIQSKLKLVWCSEYHHTIIECVYWLFLMLSLYRYITFSPVRLFSLRVARPSGAALATASLGHCFQYCLFLDELWSTASPLFLKILMG